MQSLKQLHNINLQIPKGLKKENSKEIQDKNYSTQTDPYQRSLFNKNVYGIGYSGLKGNSQGEVIWIEQIYCSLPFNVIKNIFYASLSCQYIVFHLFEQRVICLKVNLSMLFCFIHSLSVFLPQLMPITFNM